MNLRNPSGGALLGTVMGAVLLAGCTPSSSTSDATASAEPASTSTTAAEAPAGTVDPCSLVSGQKLSEITGFEMTEGDFNGGLSDSGRNVCDWRPVDEERSVPRLVITVNWGFPDAAEHRALAEEISGWSTDVEIEGATNAYALTAYRTWGMNVGDYFLKVSYIQPGNRDGGHVAEAITKEAVANLASQLG